MRGSRLPSCAPRAKPGNDAPATQALRPDIYRLVVTSLPAVSSLSGHLAEARFRELYAEHRGEILAYALRRVADPEDAADVLAETFLVAWRRFDDLPSRGQARYWLIGVARRALANQRRGDDRRSKLVERLRTELAADLVPMRAETSDGGEVLAALATLEAADQELLRLNAWEGFGPSEAASVLGISSVAARSRLHRARRRLRLALDAQRSAATARGTLEPREEE
jgi:RNA polymerase sigma factor (sigma-70 family)